MPSETPNFILRGARLATTERQPPDDRGRVEVTGDAGQDLALAERAHIEAQPQQLL